MGLTSNQEKAVACSGRPLFIQAGAGTGKTFTLTKKLGYGLSEKSGPLLRSVDSVLTITFTNKAAAELLGRVRAELRVQGLSDAALGIDAAWISTIHGMCSSILSAHALEAGIDPGTGIMAQEDSDALRQAAIDEILGDLRMQRLMDAYKPENACRLVAQAAHIVGLMPENIAHVELGPSTSQDPRSGARALYSALKNHLDSLDALGVFDGPSENCAKQTQRLQKAIEVAEELSGRQELTWQDADFAMSECAPPKGGNLKKVFREDFQEALELIADFRLLSAVVTAREHLEIALELGRSVALRHRQMKNQQGVRDTDDLLLDTVNLLQRFPHIAQEYRERFDAVMIDEFQDTDKMQVAIVRHFCDESLSTLTTVGDAQQSIYGFRGADLETYRSVRQMMRDAHGEEVSLDTNYRSHPDVLAFVESIFSKKSFFGEEFLRISAGPNNVRTYPWAPSDAPRVTMMLAAGSKEGRSSTSTADLKTAEAEMIAQRFEELARLGASYGDMAILMSSTKGAAPYLNALRSRGIPCSISGGSDFYLQKEVSILTSLLRVLELPDDDRPLLELLASPMFDLSDGDLLSLRIIARREIRNPGPGDIRPKVSLWDALCLQADRLPYNGADPLIRAYEILSCARCGMAYMPLHSVVAQCVEHSGWLEELRDEGATGAAVAANINRFCDILKELEATQGSSVVLAGEYFKNMLELAANGTGAKGKPGAMVGLGRNSVTVMTIHASKGLEFPIVAVARYARSKPKSDASHILTVSHGGSSYLNLPPRLEGEGASDVKKRYMEHGVEAGTVAESANALVYSSAVSLFSAENEAQEEKRLLYVALTRARDMLLLVSADKTFATTGTLAKGLLADIVDAILPGGFPKGDQIVQLDTGCLVECVVVNVPYDASASHEGENGDKKAVSRWHRIVECGQAVKMCRRPQKTSQQIFSYSALSRKDQGAREVMMPQIATTEEEPGAATAFGSAFHGIAQWIALQDAPSDIGMENDALKGRIRSIGRKFSLVEDDMERLEHVVTQWLCSPRFQKACGYLQLLPEHSFYVSADDVALEGFIDLLCLSSDADKALIIDYKTGTSGEGQELRRRYELQSVVYAYALLSSGRALAVEVAFVRPEANMEEVVFDYDTSQLASLKKKILKCREEAMTLGEGA